MYNIYRMRRAIAKVARTFRVEYDPGANFAEEVYPGYPGLVVAEGRARAITWGFPRVMRGKKGQLLKPRPVTNARNDNRLTILAQQFRRAAVLDPSDRLGGAARRDREDDVHLGTRFPTVSYSRSPGCGGQPSSGATFTRW